MNNHAILTALTNIRNYHTKGFVSFMMLYTLFSGCKNLMLHPCLILLHPSGAAVRAASAATSLSIFRSNPET